jgi:hypothetical protein
MVGMMLLLPPGEEPESGRVVYGPAPLPRGHGIVAAAGDASDRGDRLPGQPEWAVDAASLLVGRVANGPAVPAPRFAFCCMTSPSGAEAGRPEGHGTNAVAAGVEIASAFAPCGACWPDQLRMTVRYGGAATAMPRSRCTAPALPRGGGERSSAAAVPGETALRTAAAATARRDLYDRRVGLPLFLFHEPSARPSQSNRANPRHESSRRRAAREKRSLSPPTGWTPRGIPLLLTPFPFCPVGTSPVLPPPAAPARRLQKPPSPRARASSSCSRCRCGQCHPRPDGRPPKLSPRKDLL